MTPVLNKIGASLASFLTKRRHIHGASAPTPVRELLATLQTGDVLLVEGDTWISSAIKYLTQSTWSHAAIYVGAEREDGGTSDCLIEADLVDGVRRVGVAAFAGLPTRICRPVGLTPAERDAVARFAVDRLGHRYDLQNIVDLLRYFLPNPPVPARWRRRMIALGSGDPTRAICSTLIAQAFHSIRYPILPQIDVRNDDSPTCPGCIREILRIRHHSLFAPRDFDVSPYFQIVKPSIGETFDFRKFEWAPDSSTTANVLQNEPIGNP